MPEPFIGRFSDSLHMVMVNMSSARLWSVVNVQITKVDKMFDVVQLVDIVAQ